jgi:RpiR family carbohydrate utilization transcriptional regulator
MALLADLGDHTIKRSKSATRLAAYVLASPDRVPAMSIAQLAGAVGVSEPTVNRFCTGLGLKGYPDFKLALAAELARRTPGIASNVESGDSAAQVIDKVFDTTRASLNAVQQGLDDERVEAAVSLLDNARSILICGLGASASVALDAQHKLLRFATPVIAHTDAMNQRMTAANLDPADCLVCISYSGRTHTIVDVARLAVERGAGVIGITAPGSPLASCCELVLGVDSGEDTERYMPMTSRIGQLVLIDVLTTRLAIRKGPDIHEQLQRIKHSLADTRFPPVSADDALPS